MCVYFEVLPEHPCRGTWKTVENSYLWFGSHHNWTYMDISACKSDRWNHSGRTKQTPGQNLGESQHFTSGLGSRSSKITRESSERDREPGDTVMSPRYASWWEVAASGRRWGRRGARSAEEARAVPAGAVCLGVLGGLRDGGDGVEAAGRTALREGGVGGSLQARSRVI